jgi:predicted neutral ceramidase superfamily lipid hydrolase
MDNEALVKDVKALVKAALNDLEKVEVGMATGIVKDVSVFGHENVVRLSSTVNATIAILKTAVASSLLFAALASALLLVLL